MRYVYSAYSADNKRQKKPKLTTARNYACNPKKCTFASHAEANSTYMNYKKAQAHVVAYSFPKILHSIRYNMNASKVYY